MSLQGLCRRALQRQPDPIALYPLQLTVKDLSVSLVFDGGRRGR
jgi:hypothetical protein